jgi:hypothetical protein
VRSRLVLLGALSATAALLATACSSGSGTGPLGGGGDPGTQCFPAPGHGTTAQGWYSIQNSGKTAATVQSVRLVKPHGVAMTTKAWLMPVLQTGHGGEELYGAGFPYPPVGWAPWKHRRLAVGAVIRPGQTSNLIFGVARTARKGTSAAPVVTYTAGGNTYTWQDATTFVMVPRNCGS